MNVDLMLEYLGPETTPELVHTQFDNKSEIEICIFLDNIFTQDHNDNIKLAKIIYEFCNGITFDE